MLKSRSKASPCGEAVPHGKLGSLKSGVDQHASVSVVRYKEFYETHHTDWPGGFHLHDGLDWMQLDFTEAFRLIS
jgi:hypothetical protein